MNTKFKGEYSGTKSVSERHEINHEDLEKYLKSEVKNFEDIISLEEFIGGQSNPTYLIKTISESYVLRRKPPGKLLKSAHAVDREYKVIAALNKTDVPVPKAYLHCEDESVIGTEFFLMSFVEGEVMWEPHIPKATETERQKIYQSMNDTIAKLHSVDHVSIGLEDFGKPGNYVGRQIARWSKQYLASETREIKSMNNLMEWLPKNLPIEKETKLVHGDFSLSNVMIDLNSFGICAILDWELSTLGDPAADFSYHCIQYKLNEVLSNEKECKSLGIPTEREYLAMYEEKTGYEISKEWNLYMGFNLFKLAAISQGIMGRVRDGTAAGKNADSFGENAIMMADAAWKLINE
jgi:aminoglycoside phosphotransferase (APT) family kinase protein